LSGTPEKFIEACWFVSLQGISSAWMIEKTDSFARVKRWEKHKNAKW